MTSEINSPQHPSRFLFCKANGHQSAMAASPSIGLGRKLTGQLSKPLGDQPSFEVKKLKVTWGFQRKQTANEVPLFRPVKFLSPSRSQTGPFGLTIQPSTEGTSLNSAKSNYKYTESQGEITPKTSNATRAASPTPFSIEKQSDLLYIGQVPHLLKIEQSSLLRRRSSVHSQN